MFTLNLVMRRAGIFRVRARVSLEKVGFGLKSGSGPPVLPHLANFRKSCEFEGLIATQERSFATCEFLANFEVKKIL